MPQYRHYTPAPLSESSTSTLRVELHAIDLERWRSTGKSQSEMDVGMGKSWAIGTINVYNMWGFSIV